MQEESRSVTREGEIIPEHSLVMWATHCIGHFLNKQKTDDDYKKLNGTEGSKVVISEN